MIDSIQRQCIRIAVTYSVSETIVTNAVDVLLFLVYLTHIIEITCNTKNVRSLKNIVVKAFCLDASKRCVERGLFPRVFFYLRE